MVQNNIIFFLKQPLLLLIFLSNLRIKQEGSDISMIMHFLIFNSCITFLFKNDIAGLYTL